MSAQPQYTSIAAHLAREATTAAPERALVMLKSLVDLLHARGLTLEQIVEDAVCQKGKLARRPASPLSNKTWRAWVVYALSRRDELPEKDERHLRVCYSQQAYLTKAQIRWIHDIIFRLDPGACGTWGAPE